VRSDPALARRVLAAVVFLPVLAVLIHAGGLWYAGYWALVLTLALAEFCRMGPAPAPVWMCAAGVAAMGLWCAACAGLIGLPAEGARLARGAGWLPLLAVAALAGFLAAALGRGRPRLPAHLGRVAAGLVYVGGLGAFMFWLRAARPEGAAAGLGPAACTALAYVLTWSGDTGAYAAGLALGRHPLAPRISPHKTWEGALGGLAASALAGAALGAAAWPALGAGRGAWVGVLAGAAGQLGDLLESRVKRAFGAKDSASWIPGHGGALDRFDSLLTATPVVALLLAWRG